MDDEHQPADDATDRWHREMEELQHDTLVQYLVASAVLAVCWLFWLSSPFAPPKLMGWAVLVVLGASVLLSARLQERRYRLSSALVIVGLMVSHSLLVSVWAEPLYLAFGLVTLMVGVALLGSLAGLLVGTFCFCSSVWVWYTAHGGDHVAAVVVPLGVLYLAIWVSSHIARSPQEESLRLALSGWTKLQQALDETRERRGELRRMVRALEEATYRIERMNNELLLARQQAELARANKGRFAATVSHELRGPLNLILGFSKLMALSPERYGTPLPRPYRADVDTVYASSQHVVSLLDDILDLSQIEAEHMPLIKERIDLNQDVVREAVRTVAPLAERKGLTLRMHLDESLPQALADRVRLRQVMLNLLTNAVRFTERGGIQVRTELVERELRVSVADTGRGIAKDKISRLFDEFYQLHLAEQEGLQGSGLGLAISKQLVGLHGGRIWAESVEGEGTTLFFTIPRPEGSTTPPRSSPRTSRQAESYRSVLIVHDDPLVLRVLARYLEGYQIIGLPTGEDVVAAVAEVHPRAVVTTPAQAEALVASIAGTPFDVPILGCAMPDRRRGPQIEGMVAYLMKPITQEIVQSTLSQFPLGPDPSVLIVDDEPDATRLLGNLVDSSLSQVRLLKAYSGRQALDIMRQQTPSVVLMDLVMPDLSGEDTVKCMRADPRLASVPVVIVSGHDPATQELMLGTQLSLTSMRPVPAADGVKRLKALLDLCFPDYLPAVTAPEQSATVVST